MSYYDYIEGREIASQGRSFYGLIQAAMRQADTDNTEKLRSMFPEVHEELTQRYNAPGGILEGESYT